MILGDLAKILGGGWALKAGNGRRAGMPNYEEIPTAVVMRSPAKVDDATIDPPFSNIASLTRLALIHVKCGADRHNTASHALREFAEAARVTE